MNVYIILSFVLVYLISAAPIDTRRLRGTLGTCPIQMGDGTYVVNAYMEPLIYANLRGGKSTHANYSEDNIVRIYSQNQ